MKFGAPEKILGVGNSTGVMGVVNILVKAIFKNVKTQFNFFFL